MVKQKYLLFFVAFIVVSINVPAQTAVDSTGKNGVSSEALSALEISRFEQSPVIDGILDEEIWRKASKITDFSQFKPKEGVSMTEKTSAYIGYDHNNLYLAFEAGDSQPELVRGHLAQRDNIFTDDWVGIMLDTYGDQRRAYEFFANPLGLQGDGVSLDGAEDMSPDFVWYSKGRLTKDGYVVEMKIPFKSVRFSNTAEQNWRLSLWRSIRRKNEKGTWPALHADSGTLCAQMIAVKGVKDIVSGARLEIMPEITGSRSIPDNPQNDVFHIGGWDVRAGVNAKWGITPNWTLDSAYRPDFSQIEADAPQITVNQRYPVFYAEKRSFFTEGMDIFSTPYTLVHTRAIVDPEYGAKITGKEAGYTTGVLIARDQSRGGSDFNILRVKKDVAGQSSLGIISTDREMQGGQYNRVTALDANIQFNKIYTFVFQGAGSFTKDSGAGYNTGSLYTAGLYTSARKFNFTAQYDDISQHFRADTGFISRTDIRRISGKVSYTFWQENGPLIYWRPSVKYTRTYNYHGILTDECPSLFLDLIFPLQTNIGIYYWPNVLERFAGIDFKGKNLEFYISAEPFNFLTMSADYNTGYSINYDTANPFVGDGRYLDLTAALKPAVGLNISQTYLKSGLDTKSGARVFDENVYQTKLNMQWTREISTRLIYQYGTLEHSGFANALISYNLVPGTALYLGYNAGFARDFSRQNITGETFFFKFSYLLRI